MNWLMSGKVAEPDNNASSCCFQVSKASRWESMYTWSYADCTATRSIWRNDVFAGRLFRLPVG